MLKFILKTIFVIFCFFITFCLIWFYDHNTGFFEFVGEKTAAGFEEKITYCENVFGLEDGVKVYNRTTEVSDILYCFFGLFGLWLLPLILYITTPSLILFYLFVYLSHKVIK